MSQFTMGGVVGGVAVALIFIGMNKMKANEPPMHMMPKDIIEAYNMGLKDALRTNPASWDLEQTCLHMWANKQPVR